MRVKDYEVPDDLLYSKDHEWAKVASNAVIVGITDYAAKSLNDIVYVSLPATGRTVKQQESFGTVESIKAVSEIYSPLSGTVTKVNLELNTHPELVNQSPYETGWIMELSPSRLDSEKQNLLNAKQYAELINSTKS